MMTRHNFNTKTLDIVKIGFLVGKHPTDTHRETLHQEINMKMHKIMRNMTPEQNNEIRTTHIRNPTIQHTAAPEVRAQDSHPTWRTEAKVFETHAISLFCARDVKYLVMELMTQVYTGTPKDEFDNEPVTVKFVPYSLPYENALANSKQVFMELIQEQNLFLRNHVGIPMGGISLESMNTVLSTHMTLEETTKETGLFTGIATTNQTHRTGKRIYITTTENAAAATKFLDEDFKLAYGSLEVEDKTPF